MKSTVVLCKKSNIVIRNLIETTHKCRSNMECTPPITLLCHSVGSVRFPYMSFLGSVQLHPPSSYPSGSRLQRISQRLSPVLKNRAATPPMKVSGGQTRVKSRSKWVISLDHAPHWKTKSSLGRTQRNFHRLSPKRSLLL